MTTCNGCGDEFESKRSDARFCSTRCRVAAHRRRETEVDYRREFFRWCDDTLESLSMIPRAPHFESMSARQRSLMAQKLRDAADAIEPR